MLSGNTLVLSLLVLVLATDTAFADEPFDGVVRDTAGTVVRFVKIPAGTFSMGSPSDEPNRSDDEDDTLGPGGEPVEISISRSFWMSACETSRITFRNVSGWQPANDSEDTTHRTWAAGIDPSTLPVDSVSWYDAIVFCNKLSNQAGLKPCYTLDSITRDRESITFANVDWDRSASGFRLPTEAEWEYACRAGESDPFMTGTEIKDFEGSFQPANRASFLLTRDGPSAVGSFKPNKWGLFDMHGNVREWCYDRYERFLVGGQDPVCEKNNARRVLRGGSWTWTEWACRSAARDAFIPGARVASMGFRVVCNVQE